MRRKLRDDASAAEQRDLGWLTEANAWAKSMVIQYFEANRTGLHTVADLLTWLDDHEAAPRSWVRWLGDYQTRYQMVRNSCITLAREGYLESGSTVNSKGRDAVCYHYAGASDRWTIDVGPADHAERVSGLVRRWLYTHRAELGDVQTITITQKTIRRDESKPLAAGTGRHPRGATGPATVIRRRPASST